MRWIDSQVDKYLKSVTLKSSTFTYMSESKFKITYGETGGSKQVTFYFINKVTQADIDLMLQREFPGVPRDQINHLPGPGYIMITTGRDFEVVK